MIRLQTKQVMVSMTKTLPYIAYLLEWFLHVQCHCTVTYKLYYMRFVIFADD